MLARLNCAFGRRSKLHITETMLAPVGAVYVCFRPDVEIAYNGKLRTAQHPCIGTTLQAHRKTISYTRTLNADPIAQLLPPGSLNACLVRFTGARQVSVVVKFFHIFVFLHLL